MEITVDTLINEIAKYDISSIPKIKKAYDMAELLHAGQSRQSGEPYIIHPLNVAYILALQHADSDTICAGLLHDTLEDTNISKEEIEDEFNITISNLVDGVTKLRKLDFSSKEEQNAANTRKIITGITKDVRIIIIKLADRLHNMRTLEFKTKFKQKENSIETMEIFVPLAYYIGAYKIKNELEDLSLKFLKPDDYKRTEELRFKIENQSDELLNSMLMDINNILSNELIDGEIKTRVKNIYGIYKRLNQGKKISEIHDLLALKVIVDDITNCYVSLGLIHKLFHPMNDKFKDYICNPKTNMYQSLHSTVFGPEGRLVQAQIRTKDMETTALFGVSNYYDEIKFKYASMKNDSTDQYQFLQVLNEINNVFSDNKEFVKQVKDELLSSNIYVYTTKGEMLELPIGSTVIDFAYKIHTEVGNTMIGATVNDENVSLDYELKNKDRVRIITDSLAVPQVDWIEHVKTTNAKRKILQYKRR